MKDDFFEGEVILPPTAAVGQITFVGGDIRPCPVCGGVNGYDCVIDDSFYLKCDRCGLIYNYADLSDKEYNNIFDIDMSYIDMLDVYIKKQEEHETRAREIVEFIDESICKVRGSFVFVVGSGVGYLIEAFADRQIRYPYECVLGIDANAKKLDLSREIYEHKSYFAKAEDILSNKKFDLVFVNNVLAWTDKPISVIANAIGSTNDRGITILYIKHTSVKDSDRFYRIMWDVERLKDVCGAFSWSVSTHESNLGTFVAID